MTLRGRLYWSAAVNAAVLLGLAGICFWSLRSGTAALAHVHDDRVVPAAALQTVEADLKEVRYRMAAVQLDLLSVAGAKTHLSEARERIASSWAAFQAVAAKAQLDAEQQKLVEAMDGSMKMLEPFFAHVEAAYSASDKNKLSALLETEWPQVHVKLLKPTELLVPLQRASIKSTYDAQAAQGKRLLLLSLAAALAGVVIALGSSLRTARALLRQLGGEPALAVQAAARIAAGQLDGANDGVGSDESLMGAMRKMRKQLTGMLGQVGAVAQDLSATSRDASAGNAGLKSRMAEQAENLDRTAASLKECTDGARKNAEQAGQANTLAHSASEMAARGGKMVAGVVATIGEIQQSSGRIADITGVIDGIAFQTNILALNAAVEAARAGAQGQGFAVVAAEVRSLAQRTATAAKEIKALIEASTSKIEGGAKLVAEAGTTIQEVVKSVGRVTTIVGEIASASSEQAGGIEQVSEALDGVSKGTAALVEHAEQAGEEVYGQARKLVDAMSCFKLAAND